MPYDEASVFQQWAMDDETGMIVNVGSKLCLTGQYRENSWPSVGVANCNKEDEGQEWAFEPILFDGASKKCAPKLSKLKNNNCEPEGRACISVVGNLTARWCW